jgi:predicted RNA-binding Zn-ribbon protein involved in translation (DUF1610 family)
MSKPTEVKAELKRATGEHSAATTRIATLKSTALDRSLPLELRLRAHMQIDAIIFARHSRFQDRADDIPDKITLAKKRAERRRLDREQARRIAKGLPTRPRHRPVGGVWNSTERPDAARVDYRVCASCGKAIPDTRGVRSITCSPECRRAIYRARMVNAA